jgi:metal-sulfur cluster biosynthetic enzyme
MSEEQTPIQISMGSAPDATGSAPDVQAHEPDAPATAKTQTPGADSAASSDAPPPTSEQVKLALRKVKDPELNLNIIDLGLVYEISVDGSDVDINMTLTSPGCPAGPQIMGDVERAAKAMSGVANVNINLVWEPFWTPDKIEPRVRAYMGL